MTVHCAECDVFLCRVGTQEAAPEHCPMHGDFPTFENLYPPGEIRELLVSSARVEAAGYCSWTRLKEVVELAREMGFERIGIPHCPDMAGVAGQIADHLTAEGLTPLVPPPPQTRDPRGQAGLLDRRGTEINVLGGMCVGHEAIFIRASEVPVVALVARDSRLRHNPAAALYTSRSYLRSELFGHWRRGNRPTYQGWDDDSVMKTSTVMAHHMAHQESKRRSRLAETMDLAHRLGIRRIGISFCVGFRKEAATLTRILESNGFDVSSVCCKTGATPKEKAGIRNHEKIRPGRREMICNPVAQAEFLNRDSVQLALVLGQCVGHDAATFKTLQVPAVCLVAKDRVLAHNTTAALEPSCLNWAGEPP